MSGKSGKVPLRMRSGLDCGLSEFVIETRELAQITEKIITRRVLGTKSIRTVRRTLRGYQTARERQLHGSNKPLSSHDSF